jgi:hypothetical protein
MKTKRNSLAVVAAVLALAVLAACAAGASTLPARYADAAPEPQPQPLACELTAGAGVGFALACSEPTATPAATATATPAATATAAPAWLYFRCQPNDPICAGKSARVFWDRQLRFLRCANEWGSKVTPIAYESDPRSTDPLVWVVSGGDAGAGEMCDGWVRAAELVAPEQ